MEFPFGEQVVRERRTMVANPYNPDRPIPGTWDDDLETLTLEAEQCFIGSSSSQALPDATRSQVATSKSLFCTDVDADVKAGDRIRRGDEIWYILARPEADRNPWTNWAPVVEIPLSMTEG